jgi:hypothetical protein
MKSFYSLLFSVLVFQLIFGQQPENEYNIQWGNQNKVNNSTKLHKIIGHDQSYFYVLRKDFYYFLEKYDFKFNKILEKEQPLFFKRNQREFEKLIVFHDSIYLFTSYWNNKRLTLYVCSINKETLKQNSDERVVMVLSRSFMDQNFSFHVELSRLQTKLLVFGQISRTMPKMQTLKTKVFDKGLTVIWSDSDKIAYEHQYPLTPKVIVDDNSNVEVISQIMANYSLFKTDINQFFLITYSNNGTIKNTHYVDIPQRFLTSVNLVSFEDGSFACCGFFFGKRHNKVFRDPTANRFWTRYNYTNFNQTSNFNPRDDNSFFSRYPNLTFINDLEDCEGTFYFKFDKTNKDPVVKNIKSFDPDFLTELAKTKNFVVNNEILSLVGNNLVLRANGNIIMTAEHYDTNFSEYNKPEHILVFCFTADGAIDWHVVIPKFQYFEYYSENHCSYGLLAPHDNSEIKIYYNNNVKSSIDCSDPKTDYFNERRPSYLVEATISEYGVVSKKVVYSRKRKEITPVPLLFYDKLNGDMIMIALRNKSFRYFTLSNKN